MEFDVTIEIPQGTRNKYEMEPPDRPAFSRRRASQRSRWHTSPPGPRGHDQ